MGYDVVYWLLPHTHICPWRWLPGYKLLPKWKLSAKAFQRGEISSLHHRPRNDRTCTQPQNQNSATKYLWQEWLHVPGGPYRWPRLTRLIQLRNAALVWQGKWALKAFPVSAAVLVIARPAGKQRLSRIISALPPSPAACPWHLERSTSRSS